MTDARDAVGEDDQDLRSLLADGAASLHVELAPSQLDALMAFMQLLRQWNATYNLTAVRDPRGIVIQHLLDCLAAVPPLRRELHSHPGRRILDVGSGAGLPGIVIGIAAPETEVTCVDSVGKKAAFIAQAAALLGFRNVKALHARVEDIQEPPFDMITSRAYASLSSLIASTQRHLAEDGVWMALKGKQPDDEIAAVESRVATRIEPLVVPHLDSARCLIWMRRPGGAGQSEHTLMRQVAPMLDTKAP